MDNARLKCAIPFVGGTLVPMSDEHSGHVVRWRNDPVNAQWFLARNTFSVERHEAWLHGAEASGVDFNWVIEDGAGRPVGTVGLYNIDWNLRQAEFGRLLIGESSARGQKLARPAVRALLKAAAEVDIEKVYLVVMRHNEIAIRLYRSLGFEETSNDGTNVKMDIGLSRTS